MHRFATYSMAFVVSCCSVTLRADQGDESVTFVVRPIGHIEKKGGTTQIVLKKEYESGLLGMDALDYVEVIWWFHKNDTPEKRAILQVHPRGDKTKPLAGVFATRAPVRPNLIALTSCRVIAVKQNVLEIDSLDAFAGSPVLDLKPAVRSRTAANAED